MKNKKIKKIIFFTAALTFITIIGWIIGRPMLSLASEPEKFRLWVSKSGIWGEVGYVGMLVFQIVFAVIPGEPFEIVAGYAFGAVKGTILCIIGTTLGSVVAFILVRTFGKRIVEVFFSLDKINELKFLKNSKKRDALSFFLFLMPGTPKDLLIYFLGLTKIDFVMFLMMVSVGRIPSIVTSTVGGNALGRQNYILAVITFLVTIVISIIGYVVYQKVSTVHNKKKENNF